jgi:hypothetical protein
MRLIDLLLIGGPILMLAIVYWSLTRFRRRQLTLPWHNSFRFTLFILVVWAIYLLWTVATGDGWSRLILITWFAFGIPVALGSLLLGWAVPSLLLYYHVPGMPASAPVSAMSRNLAILVLVMVTAVVAAYIYHGRIEQQVSDATTSASRLAALNDHPVVKMDHDLARKLAGNPATPGWVLRDLARHENAWVRVAVAYNPHTPPYVVALLASDASMYVRRSIAMRDDLTRALYELLRSDESPDVRRCIAGNKATPDDILRQLMNDNSKHVRYSLVQNAGLPRELLEVLAQDEDQGVRDMATHELRQRDGGSR